MKMRRATLLAALAALLTAMVGALAHAGTDRATAVSGKIKLLSIASTRAADTKLIEDFEHLYPGVEVEGQWVANGSDLLPLLAPQLQSGQAPDVFLVYGGTGVNPSMTALAKAGHLQDLSSSPWVKRIPKVIRELTLVNSRPHMWMMGVQAGLVLYNTSEFRRLELKPPTTFPQLLALCRTIQQKASGKIPMAFSGGAAGTAAPNIVQFAVEDVYAKDPNWTTKRLAGTTSFARTAGWAATFQRLQDMKSAGCFSPGVAADTLQASQAQFASQQALMMIGPTFITATIDRLNPNLAYSMFVLPGKTAADTRLTIYPSQGLAVNAKSKNAEAARAFVNYAARQAPNAQWAKANGVMAPWDYGKKLLPAQYKQLVPFVDKSIAGPYLRWPTGLTFVTLGTSAQGILTGQKTISQVLTDLDNSWGK